LASDGINSPLEFNQAILDILTYLPPILQAIDELREGTPPSDPSPGDNLACLNLHVDVDSLAILFSAFQPSSSGTNT